ncbi:hypothetical protein YQE_01730, partial [Dendroctonus ponderosae]
MKVKKTILILMAISYAGSAAATLTNCIEQWQVVKICEESPHTKWINCDVSATTSRGDPSGSTPSTYWRSNTLHLPLSFKPSTKAPSYFNGDLDEESDIFGDKFQLAVESLDEVALFNSIGQLSEDEEEGEITTLEPDTSTSTSTSTTPASTTTPTPTTLTPISSTDSTIPTSRLPRTTPETSGSESSSTVWIMLVLYLGWGLLIL